jgi:hypothetical protein
MDKKTKVLFIVLILLLIASVGATFYRYMIQKDYLIFAHVECNPQEESCFYYPCEEGDSECDPTAIEYYKKITKKAFNIEICNTEDEDCNPLVCKNGEKDCEITTCTVDNIEEGESCSE